MRQFRLAFWMTDPVGGPGDIVEVPDSRVDALVKAGIGRPEDDAAPPADDPAGAPDQQPPAPAARPKKTAKAPEAG